MRKLAAKKAVRLFLLSFFSIDSFCFSNHNKNVRKLSAVLFAIFIVSSSLTAHPSHGPAGGPAGGSAPSFGAQRSGSVSSGNNSAPPPPPGGQKGPGPGGRSGPPPGSSSGPSSGGSSLGPSSPYGPNGNLWNYRGKRTAAVTSPLEVVGKTILFIKNRLQLVIQFNQAVNPSGMKASSIFLNERKLPEEIKIKFNRKADSVTLTFIDDFISKEDLESATIILRDIQTFDGKSVKELIVK